MEKESGIEFITLSVKVEGHRRTSTDSRKRVLESSSETDVTETFWWWALSDPVD